MFTLSLVLSSAFTLVFAQNDSWSTDVDSAWIASQNGGRTELNDGNNEPNPDCIGDALLRAVRVEMPRPFAQEVAHQHGGAITVTSSESAGTAFIATLPCA